MSRLAALFAALALATNFGCGGCGGDDENSATPNNDASTVPGSLGPVLSSACDFIERCPTDDFALAYKSKGECAQILDFVLTCRVVREGDDDFETVRVEQVPIPISATQQAACVDWLQNVPCGEGLGEGDSPCDFLGSAFGDGDDDDFDGARRGEMCEQESCSPGLECVDSEVSTGDIDYCRICVAPGGPGTPCVSPFRPCEEGLQCNSQLGVCDYPVLEDESCELGDRACDEGLFCDPTSKICRAMLADGENCLYDERPQSWYCASSFCNPTTGRCDPGGMAGDPCTTVEDCRDTFRTTCEGGACTPPRLNGQPCAEDAQCENRECDEATGRCGGPDGTECFDARACQSNYCDRGTDTCAQTKGLGESCDSSDECGLNRCAYTSFGSSFGTCLVPCDDATPCGAGEVCDSGGCLPLKPDGQSCDNDEQCESGWCSNADVCGTKPGLGDACTDTFDCYPLGYCSGGVCVAKLGPGAACSGYESCMEPYVCLEGTCERIGLDCVPAAIGQRCTWLQVCAEGAYCDVFDNFRCRAQKPDGESCLRSHECAGGSVCGGGVCQPTAAVGEDCSTTVCTPGLYCDRDDRTCQPLKAAGEPCEDSDECGEDEAYCDGTVCVSNNPAPTCVLPEED